MNEETFIILGFPVRLRYNIHQRPSYVEWHIVDDMSNASTVELLEQLLRVHYTQWIENVIREHEWRRSNEDTSPDPEMF